MPQDLLAFPPYYTVVGIYRLVHDASLRSAVWAKVKHATIRGLVVGAVYAGVTYRVQRWFVATFLLGGWGLFGGKVKPPPEVVSQSLGWLREVDVVDYTTILFLLPQLSALLNYFLKRNLRLARARAFDLTVKSRNKPPEFWERGYVEEWERPPVVGAERSKGLGRRTDGVLGWIMWWPTQMFVRHYILIPISPILPIFNLAFNAATRGLYTARTLHEPYFALKKMTPAEIDVWMEERKWGYRTFGFAASALEQIPLLGIAFSISNRIGSAMWAFDLEKRQHRFASGELRRLRPDEVGLGAGAGAVANAAEEVEMNVLGKKEL